MIIEDLLVLVRSDPAAKAAQDQLERFSHGTPLSRDVTLEEAKQLTSFVMKDGILEVS